LLFWTEAAQCISVSKTSIKKIIEEQTNKYKWQFTYLGANQDAFTEAYSLGIVSSATYATSKSHEAFIAASNNTSRMREATVSNANVVNEYTVNELRSMSE
jgi:hypothetical protein